MFQHTQGIRWQPPANGWRLKGSDAQELGQS